ncbi:ZIP family zinc transporter [Pelagivirga sediminicola]|uniref:ZIP family zinc transporter n=1 Tax=Pelagivirga sediminicola TaxID=2170575 RepID=A0A2T7GAE6_9RHOB|nr:ZIP family zinc transporter [Pelagivirga sediminicola]PVA11391.1 ZIP family zinc transporter [Pelagivirga sediminicola]
MQMIPLEIQAALWGLVAGGALLLGAAAGYFLRVPTRLASMIMAFGVGVLVSVLAFNLMDEAARTGGIGAAVAGFAAGGSVFALANSVLARAGAGERKNSARSGAGTAAASLAIAVGSLLDGIPESAAIGISLLDGEGVALVTMLAIFISNVPEGLSSTVGMKAEGKSAWYIFRIWGVIMLACSFSAFAGVALIGALGGFWIGGATAFAAGAIFVMLIDTMIPEAFDEIHALSGPVAAVGFLLAFAATHLL